jgi:UDP:flavonoid glycosyltransferase YjiC (YdhE family)
LQKLYIGVFGSGLGHAVRMLPIARAAKRMGLDVILSSSGDAVRYLRSCGFTCHEIPYVDVVYNRSGSFTAKETAKLSLPIFLRFFKQIGYEGRNIGDFSPDLVISDSVVATVIAARALGMRAVTVLNQLRLESSPRTPWVFAEMLSSASVALGGIFWGLSDRILLPDLPPPHTISERNLWSAGKILSKSEYIGFLTPPVDEASDSVTEKLRGDSRMKVFWQISGPVQTRVPLLKKAMAMAQSLEGSVTTVISGGTPGGDTTPRPIRGGYLYDWCGVRDTLVKLADVVVSRAGHTSISQFILSGKPSILIPITSQREQEGNALKAQAMGVAVCISEQELDKEHLDRALEDVRGDAFKRRTAEMRTYANRFDALSSITRLFQSE